MLAIYRQQISARLTRRPRHQFAGHHQRLFVRQTDAPAHLKRPVGRHETDRANRGRNDDINPIHRRDGDQTIFAAGKLRQLANSGGAQLLF